VYKALTSILKNNMVMGRKKPTKLSSSIYNHADNTLKRQAKKEQLWEPCENCGDVKNPVYLPLHLCDNCWPEN